MSLDEPVSRPVRPSQVAAYYQSEQKLDSYAAPANCAQQEAKETPVAFEDDNERYRRYMRPEAQMPEKTDIEKMAAEQENSVNQTEEARPLSRRERRMFFEGKNNEEDDE